MTSGAATARFLQISTNCLFNSMGNQILVEATCVMPGAHLNIKLPFGAYTSKNVSVSNS